MTVTQAAKSDLPQMITLLKQSLGESLIPKSEEYFVWKHHENPFGASKVLLAKDDDKIIGLRAFMYWTWASGKDSITAVRAVDTATDPAYQGKGIFRKLTMQAVDECKADGVGLVFNSPNPISMSGYLKMGWHQAGKMPIYIGPGSVFPRRYGAGKEEKLLTQYPVHKAIEPLKGAIFAEANNKAWHTPIDFKYLEWRYQHCPIVRYGAIIEKGQFGFVFRLKKLKWFYELRICEAWTENDSSITEKKAAKALKKLIRHIRPAIVTCAPSPGYLSGKKKPAGLFGPFNKGPMVTLRPLALDNLNNFDAFSHWQPSMGTMELF